MMSSADDMESDSLLSSSTKTIASMTTDQVDVLVVGAGPAGMMLGAQLAKIGNVNMMVVDQRRAPPETGNADGVQVRSVEVFDAFGFAGKVLDEAYHVIETSFWQTTAEGKKVHRSRARDTPVGVSTFPHVILAQNKIMNHFADVMHKHGNQTVQYSRKLLSVKMPQSTQHSSHPVHVDLLDTCTDRVETVRCKYLVGVDGSHSAVRKQFDVQFEGEHTTAVWGVMDVFVDTDFPDIRVKTVIQTPDHGNLLIIPREGGQLVRFYIELMTLEVGQRLDNNAITVDHLINRAKKIFAPFEVEVAEVQWWSCYQVGQRVAQSFTVEDALGHPRIFLGGDASHSHSPKAGQGMNVSMHDAFNLGWKLAHVVQGKASAELLNTYDAERRKVAQDLITFDHKFAKAFVEGTKGGDKGLTGSSFETMFREQELFTAGLATQYTCKHLLVPSLAHSELVGRRLPPAQVVRLSDAKVVQLPSLLKADGRWRILVFAGDHSNAEHAIRLEKFCQFMETSERSPLVKHRSRSQSFEHLIETSFVFACSRDAVQPSQLPSLCCPRVGRLNLRANDRAFCDTASYHQGHGRAYDTLGIPQNDGTVVIVRPDQYVSATFDLEDYTGIASFFDTIYLKTASSN